MKNETIEALGATGSKTIVTGAGLTSFGWITSNEFLGLVGAVVAIAGLVITWYYKREANRRHAREHELRMARLRRGMDTPNTDLAEQGADE
jgi:uncharacterized membrane protein